MIKFPSKPGAFKQVGNSDVLGNIWSSFNLDLTENEGRMRVAPRGMIVSKSDDSGLTNMTTPVAFKMFATNSGDQKIWAIAGDLFYNTGRPSDPFIVDATANSPAVGNGSDMELFNGALYVIGTTEIRKYDGSTWTEIGANIGTTITTTCVYGGRLYYSKNSSAISSISLADAVSDASGTPNTVAYTLQLSDFGVGTSSANTISCIRASSNRIWIATVDKTSQNYSAGRAGKVFEWDGVSTQANKVYYLDSVGALSMIIKDDAPYIVDANGKLMAFNGSGFVEVARLPIPSNVYLRNPTNALTQQFIHPRGMAIRNDKILILINNLVDNATGTIIENLPSGVWEYDKDKGLYHKYSLSQWQYRSTETRTDYAQNRLNEVGALFSAKSTNNGATLNGDLLIGASYYQTASTSKYGIFINDTVNTTSKVGYIVTTKIDSQNVEDVWQKVYATYKKLIGEDDKIIVKYRTDETPPVEIVISWTSTTTFTVNDDVSAYIVGDEVEITSGSGSGQIENIASISTVAGVQTITLENPVIGATGTSRARFQHWITLDTATQNDLDYKEFSINKSSSWIQLKCVMYFTSTDELNSLQLVNKTQTPSI